MKTLLVVISLLLSFTCFAQNMPIGIFQKNVDIGSPKNVGNATYDSNSQAYTLKGSGYNIWFDRDEFNYTYSRVRGDFILTANFAFVGEGADPHRKIGLMVRESIEDNSPHASAVLHGDGLTLMQWREMKGASMRDPEDQAFSNKHSFKILQIERSGNKIIMRAAHDGEPLQVIGAHEFPDLPEEVLAGLFMCSHNEDEIEEAKVWNVRLDKPASENYSVNENGYLGCRLETLDVFTGEREVIYEKDDRFEAPNWMPDGKKLLFNMEGALYKIPVEGGELEKLNTGFADRNNNDHGISFDGKTLAISHHRDGMPGGGSTVYVLPLEGGTPKLVTENTPSYWHGWAPNNKEVVYVARRDGNESYNIYKANIDTKEETQLTFNEGTHVDGCEYSPDGEWIYYNGSQSGTMQLWRMKPDGSGNEQITFDEYNDWFPHISPDGKWIAYLSFVSPIDVDAHPSYKQVMLRLMPASGGAPRVIAYLYGGQGSINVPSWSPDSKSIAFVSNSGRIK